MLINWIFIFNQMVMYMLLMEHVYLGIFQVRTSQDELKLKLQWTKAHCSYDNISVRLITAGNNMTYNAKFEEEWLLSGPASVYRVYYYILDTQRNISHFDDGVVRIDFKYFGNAVYKNVFLFSVAVLVFNRVFEQKQKICLFTPFKPKNVLL